MANCTHVSQGSNGDVLHGALGRDHGVVLTCLAPKAGNLPYAILGLVARHADGVHGYQLKHELESICDESLHLSYGSVYSTLELLAAVEHLERTDCIQLGRPNRKMYRITKEGERSLESWLSLPVSPDSRPFRDELSLKILFAPRVSLAVLQSQIERQRSFILTRLARIVRRRKRLAKTRLEIAAVDVVLAGPEMRMHADLAWLKQVEAKLALE